MTHININDYTNPWAKCIRCATRTNADVSLLTLETYTDVLTSTLKMCQLGFGLRIVFYRKRVNNKKKTATSKDRLCYYCKLDEKKQTKEKKNDCEKRR